MKRALRGEPEYYVVSTVEMAFFVFVVFFFAGLFKWLMEFD